MAKTKTTAPERSSFVTIRSGRRKTKLATWQYFSIVDTLRDMRASRQDAIDTAKWCGRTAKPGDRRELEPEIVLEVTEK